MALKPPPSNVIPTAPQIAQGIFPARLVSIIYLGQLQNNDKVDTKIRLEWEIIGHTYEANGKTYDRVIGEDFYFYWLGKDGRSKFAQRCDQLAGVELPEDVDLYDLLGTYCRLNVALNPKGDKVYTNVGSVKPWTADDGDVPAGNVKLLKVDFDENIDNVKLLPQWIRNIVTKALDYPNRQAPAATPPAGAHGTKQEQIPF